MLRLDPDEKSKLDEQDSIILNCNSTSLKTRIERPTKSYNDSAHEKNRNGRDLSSVFNDRDNEFDKNRLTNLDSVTINRNLGSDIELANKKYIDDELDKKNKLRFNQTLENYLKVSVGNDVDNLTTNMIKSKLLKQRLSNFPTQVQIFYTIGILLLVINLITVLITNIYDQQRQTVQAQTQEQPQYPL